LVVVSSLLFGHGVIGATEEEGRRRRRGEGWRRRRKWFLSSVSML